MNNTANKSTNVFLFLPDDLLYQITTFIAGVTDRAFVLCHILMPLCSSVRESITRDRSSLWSMILNEYTHIGSSKRKTISVSCKQTRCSKRLRRHSMKDKVKDSHQLLCDRTNIAFYALSEMVNSPRTPLSLGHLRWIFQNYGPFLRCNQYHYDGSGTSSDTSGTFLIACCRARHVKESVILRCIKELIEKHGALPDVNTSCSKNHVKNEKTQMKRTTPLCIASARAMSSVVKYLLRVGASVDIEGTDSIPLLSNPYKRIRGTYSPMEFALQMYEKSKQNVDVGPTLSKKLKALENCIRMLKKAEQANQKTKDCVL